MTVVLPFLLKNWRVAALAALMAFAGLQTARLNHAKADQFDRSACIKGQPCKPPKWKAEVAALRDSLRTAQDGLSMCRANTDTLKASIARQNAAVSAIQADSDARLAQATKAAKVNRAETVAAEKMSSALLSRQLLGSDACARADDARRAFLEMSR